MRFIPAALAAIFIMSACARKEASVIGHLIVPENDKVYLEKVLPGATVTVDSTSVDERGKFAFRIKDLDPTPTIYYLRSGTGSATLLLERGEKARIEAIGSFSDDYSIKGSPGSERMLELRDIINSAIDRLDSIMTEFSEATAGEKKAVWASYAEQYYAAKRQQLNFITVQPSSIASLYALYQRMPNATVLADGKTDVFYYQLVADSAGAKYPESPYVKALNQNLKEYEQRADMAELLKKSLSEEPSDYPEIEMPDIYGVKHKLSDLHGKVIILDFWSTRSPGSSINNAEMKKLYELYSDRGLEIYQVGMDTEKQPWVLAVTTQKLPWVAVSDLRGTGSPYIQRYNIRSLPANFIIDRNGGIVGKNLFGEELEKRIEKLI